MFPIKDNFMKCYLFNTFATYRIELCIWSRTQTHTHSMYCYIFTTKTHSIDLTMNCFFYCCFFSIIFLFFLLSLNIFNVRSSKWFVYIPSFNLAINLCKCTKLSEISYKMKHRTLKRAKSFVNRSMTDSVLYAALYETWMYCIRWWKSNISMTREHELPYTFR